MKALTLWQPWAQLVAMGVKSVETRCWNTSYRGPLAIHAAQRIPFKELGTSRDSAAFHAAASKWGCPPSAWANLPTGSVLCIVNLINVVAITPALVSDLTPRERAFGNYDAGRYAWCLELVERLETPIPAKGNQMLWNWERPNA